MATITTKYNIGDKVWTAGSSYQQKTIQCPDCLGTKKWTITFADKHSEETKCFTCSRSYDGSLGYISYNEWQPTIEEYTIGLIQGMDNGIPIYMCKETGIGSGTLHRENNLFATKAEAEIYAQEEYIKRMAYIAENNFPKKGSFAKALERDVYGFSRYEALRKEKQMRQWIELIKDNQQKGE